MTNVVDSFGRRIDYLRVSVTDRCSQVLPAMRAVPDYQCDAEQTAFGQMVTLGG